jgi:copper transport protein
VLHRAALLAGALAGLLMLTAAPAQAHATLSSSNPPAGARLGATPSVVTLNFDEPLAAKLSDASVTTPNGTRFTGTVSGETMRVRLRGNAPGAYHVDWKTVSQLDGHTITGHFEFGVGVTVPGSPGSSSVPSINGSDLGLAVPRAIEYALLVLACGMAFLQLVGHGVGARWPSRTVAVTLLVSGLVVVAAEAGVAASGLSASGILAYLTQGTPGWARVARVAIEAALVLFAAARRRLSAVLLTGVVAAVAVAGHGADVEPPWQGIAANAAHLEAAGVWAGGIMALALLRLTGQWRPSGEHLLPRFTQVAPWAFGVSVALGAVQAAQLLGSPDPLVTTAYGWTLLVKAAAIGLMVPLSLLAWRRLRISVRTEALLALIAVCAAAALAAFPVIPKEAREAAAEAASGNTSAPAGTRALWAPKAGDLTMGGRAGSVMVGLSLHPGRPGRNTVHAYLASPADARSSATVRVGGKRTRLSSCGQRCRVGTVMLTGHQALQIAISGPGGGTATYILPRLPAPDGTALARRAADTMMRLHSYRVKEDLSGVRSYYVYRVPHQIFLRTYYGSGAVDTLWVGKRLFRRDHPGGPWKLTGNGVKGPVPYFVWHPFRPFVAARVIGHTRMRGKRVTLVSVFGGHGADPDAVWFTLYVDPSTSRVLRSRMWATNHFMDDRFLSFDQPVTIPKPPPAH